MTDRIRERLKNQGVAFTRQTAETQLRRAGVKLSPEWTRDRVVKAIQGEASAPQTAKR